MPSFEEMYSTTLGGAYNAGFRLVYHADGIACRLRTVRYFGRFEMRTAYTRRTAALVCSAKPPASVRRAESV